MPLLFSHTIHVRSSISLTPRKSRNGPTMAAACICSALSPCPKTESGLPPWGTFPHRRIYLGPHICKTNREPITANKGGPSTKITHPKITKVKLSIRDTDSKFALQVLRLAYPSQHSSIRMLGPQLITQAVPANAQGFTHHNSLLLIFDYYDIVLKRQWWEDGCGETGDLPVEILFCCENFYVSITQLNPRNVYEDVENM